MPLVSRLVEPRRRARGHARDRDRPDLVLRHARPPLPQAGRAAPATTQEGRRQRVASATVVGLITGILVVVVSSSCSSAPERARRQTSPAHRERGHRGRRARASARRRSCGTRIAGLLHLPGGPVRRGRHRRPRDDERDRLRARSRSSRCAHAPSAQFDGTLTSSRTAPSRSPATRRADGAARSSTSASRCGEDPDRVRAVLEELFDELRATRSRSRTGSASGPQVLGVDPDSPTSPRSSGSSPRPCRASGSRSSGCCGSGSAQRIAERGIRVPPMPATPGAGAAHAEQPNVPTYAVRAMAELPSRRVDDLQDVVRASTPIWPTAACAPRSTSSLSLGKPLLLEGEAGVGKTEVAKVLAALLGRRADPPAVLRGDRRLARRSTSGTTRAS